MRRQRLPLTVDCEGCGRTLEVKKYLSSFPAMDVPEHRLTWTVIQQCHLAFELLVHMDTTRSGPASSVRSRARLIGV